MVAKQKDPQTVTVQGRLSYASFTPEEAHQLSLKGKYPTADAASTKPHFNVLLEQAQHDKLVAHLEDVFFPWTNEQHAAGEKRNALPPADSAKLIKDIKKFADATLNVGIKEVPEKTQPLAPECVSSIKVSGQKGVAIVQKAAVYSEDELRVPEPDILTYPVIRPINATVHELYPGSIVAVTLNVWSSYNDPKRPLLGLSASTVVFKADAERFGGGVAVDEDDIFADD